MSIEDEARAAVDAAKTEVRHLLGRDQPAPPPQQAQQRPQATFTPAARIRPSQSPQPEVHMPSALLTDAEKAAKALVTHVSALLGNPLVDAIVEAGLGMVLTPGETSAVIAFIQAIEAERAQQAAQMPDGVRQPPAPAQAAGGQQPAQQPKTPSVVM